MTTPRHLDVPWHGALDLYRITQPYGPTAFTSEPSYEGYPHFHLGIDFALPEWTPVLAAADGKVTFAGWDTTGFGNCIRLDHGNGLQTLYGHLDSFSANQGDTVSAGQQIALSDNTGNSTGPHLHFSVLQDWAWENPWPYLTAPIPAPQPPPAQHWQLLVAMHFRPRPTAFSTPQGALLPVGTKVVELDPPNGGEREQNGWAYCRTSGDVAGWLLMSNMEKYTP